MKKIKLSYILLVFAILAIILLVSYLIGQQKQEIFQKETAQGVLDLSSKFRILPEKSYSIESNIIKNEILSVPSLPKRFGVKIPYKNEYPNPLWFSDCNKGVLEKKSILGWEEVNKEQCESSNIGSFVNRGIGEFYYVVTLEEGIVGKVKKIDRTGTYRVRADLVYGCKAIKKEEQTIYTNCEGNGVSYSPEFKIIN